MTLSADVTDIFGAEALQDPYPHYARMRDRAPVQQIGDSVFYAVCGWDAVTEAVGQRRRASATTEGVMSGGVATTTTSGVGDASPSS